MVYYFTSTVVDPPAYVYVGKDKFESMYDTNGDGYSYRCEEPMLTVLTDEELIKYGWEEDVW